MDNKTKLLNALIKEHEQVGVGSRSLTALSREIGISVSRKELEQWFAWERPLRYRGFAFTYQFPKADLPPTLAIIRE